MDEQRQWRGSFAHNSKQNNVAVLLALKKDMVKTYRNDKKVYNLVRACTCGIVVFV